VASPAAAQAPDRASGLTAEIAKAPSDPTLYVKRARIYVERGEHEAAIADLEQAAELPGGIGPAAHVHVPLLLRLNRPGEARERAARARAATPDDPVLLLLEAQALESLGRVREAVESYRGFMARQPSPQIEHYFELGRLLTSLGDGKSKRAAIDVYDRGLRALGPVVTLVFPAIELEIELRRWDQALARLASLAPQYANRQDILLSRKAEILRKAGRVRKAQEAEAAARKEREKVPVHVR
jgi:tetratricopeptide (TPR) repeat protein